MSKALIQARQGLIPNQRLTLAQRVTIIERAEANIEREFYTIGQQLWVIRETKQYEEDGYFSFEDFCQRCLRRTYERARQLIQAYKTVENFPTMVGEFSTVSNERQVRQLIQEQKTEARELEREAERDWNRVMFNGSDDDIGDKKCSGEWGDEEDEELDYDSPKPHVAHNSGNNEWYTPAPYVDAAFDVMGGIDLDPASSAAANEIIEAATYYTAEDDGLTKEWAGRVWMNPPYVGELIGKFTSKLCEHFNAGEITEAIVLVNNATETGWFQEMLATASAICFPKGRIKYLDATGASAGAPLQGQAFLYFGKTPNRFKKLFSQFGGVR